MWSNTVTDNINCDYIKRLTLFCYFLRLFDIIVKLWRSNDVVTAHMLTTVTLVTMFEGLRHNWTLFITKILVNSLIWHQMMG